MCSNGAYVRVCVCVFNGACYFLCVSVVTSSVYLYLTLQKKRLYAVYSVTVSKKY